MRAAGWTYWPIPEDRINLTPPFPYVITNRAWAAAYGFGSPPAPADPNGTYVATLSDERKNAYADALVGTAGGGGGGVSATLPDGSVLGHSAIGCQARAATGLYGNFQDWFAASSTVQELPRIRRQMVTSDPRYRAATNTWSACMTARGFNFPDPGHAAVAYPRPSGRPSSAEINTAVAEADCAASSGLGDLAGRLDESFGKEVNHKYQVNLDAFWRLERAALPLAHRILAAPSPSAP